MWFCSGSHHLPPLFSQIPLPSLKMMKADTQIGPETDRSGDMSIKTMHANRGRRGDQKIGHLHREGGKRVGNWQSRPALPPNWSERARGLNRQIGLRFGEPSPTYPVRLDSPGLKTRMLRTSITYFPPVPGSAKIAFCHLVTKYSLLGEALNGNIGLSLKDRKICFLFLFYDRTVLFD